MTAPAPVFSDEQAEAHDRIAESLRGLGVDIDRGTITPMAEGKSDVLAVIGKAGSGKTLLLAELVKALEAAGVEIISGDWEGRRRKDRRTMAILAPTNKAASVLRARGVPATTIHRILYTPVYDPEFEKVAEWLAGQGERPVIEALTDAALDRAKAVYETRNRSPPRWPPPACAGPISSPAGNAGTARSTSASSTKAPCSTLASTRT
jgi:exodeoxyribonuclease-5